MWAYLVQSEIGTDQLSLVRAFLQILNNQEATGHLEVLLVALRSSFRGTYLSETPPKVRLPLDLKESPPDLGRPFYLLVISPSSADLLLFEKYVLNGLEGKTSFRPTEAPLLVEKADFVPLDRVSQPVWNRYGPLKILTDRSGPMMLIGAFIERGDPHGEASTLRLRLIAQPSISLMSPANFVYQVERTTFRMGKAEQRPTPVALQPAIEGKPDNGVFIVTYPFPRPAPYSWDVYRIRVRAGKSNLTVPPWVTQWSTENDQIRENGNRTLHLNLLVEAMVRAISEDVVFANECISLGRGE